MTTQRHWYNDRELFLQGLVRSNYVTSITDWFMGFAGKWAELVLYGTVLYSCAELYPGVHLPVELSLAVFLIQMGALDIGGLSLGKLAKQAREDGNTRGADQAATLSKWLIAIMLTGVATVGIEHVVLLPNQVHTHSIQMQIGLCKAHCAKHGYFLLEDRMYSEAQGGTDETDPPELARLRKAAQQGLIDVLVIASRERLTRDARANALLIEQLKAKGRAIEIVEESQSEQQ